MGQENRLAPWSFSAGRGNLKNVVTESVNASTPPINAGVTSDIWQDGGILVQQSAAQRMRIVSSSASDTAGGSGARLVLVRGLDSNFELLSELVAMNGTTPVFTVNTYRRHFRTAVIESGTFGTTIISSLAGTLTLDWESTTDLISTITPNTNAFSQASTRLTHITVPRGFSGQIPAFSLSVDGTKPISAALMFRLNSDESSAPFGSVQIAAKSDSFSGKGETILPNPFTFPETTDIWMACTSGSNATVVEGGFGLIAIRLNS